MADTVPNVWNLSRFLKILADIEQDQCMVSVKVSDLRPALMAETPNFGNRIWKI